MKKIMIVDDSKFMRTMIKNILQNEEYVFCEASDGIEALAMYPNEKPDVVLLDITIPFMNGELLLKELRKETQIPIIMVTKWSRQ